MCGTKSVAYFAHDPAHRLLAAAGEDGEFTCGGCLVAGAGLRYRCAHPGCGFTIHEACARRCPRTLKSAVHPWHRLVRRRQTATDGDACEVCGEGVMGACYACASCGVAVHPLCARMRGTASGPAHPGGHEAWLVRVVASSPASGCDACGRALGVWRYRCPTCTVELHPRCLVPVADQCRRGAGEGRGRPESLASRCCWGLVHHLTRCLEMEGTALRYGYY